MASDLSYVNYIIDQLCDLRIEFKRMMGEYLLYYKDVIVGGVFDNRLLIKKVKELEDYKMIEVIPYPKAKPMYLIEDIDDSDLLIEIIKKTYKGLTNFNI